VSPEEVLALIRGRHKPHLTVVAPHSAELERRVLELAEFLGEHQDEVVVRYNERLLRVGPGLTPESFVEKVRRVLGYIALDPASSPEANARVKANQFFSREDDGFSKVWWGPLFLSPPGGRLGITQRKWWERLVEQWTAQPGHSRDWWSAVFLGQCADHFRDGSGGAATQRVVPVRFDLRPGMPSEVETEAAVILLSTGEEVKRRFREEFGP
jgi:hypothetical protein